MNCLMTLYVQFSPTLYVQLQFSRSSYAESKTVYVARSHLHTTLDTLNAFPRS